MDPLKPILQSILSEVTFDPDWAAAAVRIAKSQPENS